MSADLQLDGSKFRLLAHAACINRSLKIRTIDGCLQLTIGQISVAHHALVIIILASILGGLIYFSFLSSFDGSWIQLIRKAPGAVFLVTSIYMIAVFGPSIISLFEGKYFNSICPLFEYKNSTKEISLKKQTEVFSAEQFAGFLIYSEYVGKWNSSSGRSLIVELQALRFENGELVATVIVASTDLYATSRLLKSLKQLAKQFPTAIYQQSANTFRSNERCNDVKRLV